MLRDEERIVNEAMTQSIHPALCVPGLAVQIIYQRAVSGTPGESFLGT